MKLLTASAVALLLVLSGCKKSSNPEPAPAPAQSTAPVQAPRDAGVAPSVDAGAVDAGSADAKAGEPGGDAGTVATDAAKAGSSVVRHIVAQGCGFDPGSEALREKDSAARNGEATTGSKDYDSTYDCAPEDEFDQNCSPDRCWSAQDTCRNQCGSTCEDCKKKCQPSCDTCMGRCTTDECKAGCATATDICLSECLTARRSCRGECESKYTACSKDFEKLWAEKCEAPCKAYVDCFWACNNNDEKRDEARIEACQKACPDYPDECNPECLQRLQ